MKQFYDMLESARERLHEVEFTSVKTYLTKDGFCRLNETSFLEDIGEKLAREEEIIGDEYEAKLSKFNQQEDSINPLGMEIDTLLIKKDLPEETLLGESVYEESSRFIDLMRSLPMTKAALNEACFREESEIRITKQDLIDAKERLEDFKDDIDDMKDELNKLTYAFTCRIEDINDKVEDDIEEEEPKEVIDDDLDKARQVIFSQVQEGYKFLRKRYQLVEQAKNDIAVLEAVMNYDVHSAKESNFIAKEAFTEAMENINELYESLDSVDLKRYKTVKALTEAATSGGKITEKYNKDALEKYGDRAAQSKAIDLVMDTFLVPNLKRPEEFKNTAIKNINKEFDMDKLTLPEMKKKYKSYKGHWYKLWLDRADVKLSALSPNKKDKEGRDIEYPGFDVKYDYKLAKSDITNAIKTLKDPKTIKEIDDAYKQQVSANRDFNAYNGPGLFEDIVNNIIIATSSKDKKARNYSLAAADIKKRAVTATLFNYTTIKYNQLLTICTQARKIVQLAARDTTNEGALFLKEAYEQSALELKAMCEAELKLVDFFMEEALDVEGYDVEINTVIDTIEDETEPVDTEGKEVSNDPEVVEESTKEEKPSPYTVEELAMMDRIARKYKRDK